MSLKRLATAFLLSVAGLIGAGPDARLADAAKKMDRAAIRALLAQKADVNAPQVDGTTALAWAAYHDDMEIVAALVKAGADVKVANRYGVTPLSLACTNGNGPIVDLLLKAGADPNTTQPGGESALMIASRTGNLAAVKALLARGADVKAKESRHGQTALMRAAVEGHAVVVEELIEHGADFRARLDSGFTALLFAVREGQTGVVRSLLKAGADVNDTIKPVQGYGQTKGYQYAREKSPRAGSSALHLAVANAHYELAAFLLEAGADPNAMGPGYAPLHNIPSIRKPGGGDNDPAPRGSGAISSLDLVKLLAKHGADLNARLTRRVNFGLTGLNTSGATPFLLAALTADTELMRALAALGADPLLPNKDNATPLIVAAGLGTRSPGEDAGTESEVVEAMKLALELGNDINAVDNNGETAMHGAAYKNLPAAAQLLIDKGANIEIWNRKNKRGWTPLLIAEGYRFGNFKPSPETAAVIRKAMADKGLSTVVVPPAPNLTDQN
jgi:ankyrin repeat protein